MKTVVLDGNLFNDLEGFFCEIDRLLTKNLQWKTGHNLNAYNDLLRGGFGFHEYGEPITIKWTNYQKSKRDLGEELFFVLWKLRWIAIIPIMIVNWSYISFDSTIDTFLKPPYNILD